jgi:flagellar hook assembly protein FlgD
MTARLIGPDGSSRTIDSGLRGPGVRRFDWPGTKADGSAEAEGRWRFNVTAVDDLRRASAADRFFFLNDTLAGLSVQPTSLYLRHGLLVATYTLAHPARVTVTVATASGIVVRRLLRASLQPGPQTVSWNGRRGGGALAFGGRYVVRVSATNEFGRVDLVQPFTAHR